MTIAFDWALVTDAVSHDAGAVELRNSLASKYGVELTATAVFDYPTVDALVTFVASKLAEAEPAAASASEDDSEEEQESPAVDLQSIEY